MRTRNEVAGRECERSCATVWPPGRSSRSPKRRDMGLNKHFDFSYIADVACWGSNSTAGKNSTK